MLMVLSAEVIYIRKFFLIIFDLIFRKVFGLSAFFVSLGNVGCGPVGILGLFEHFELDPVVEVLFEHSFHFLIKSAANKSNSPYIRWLVRPAIF